MSENGQQPTTPDTSLLDRVVVILERARVNVVRSVNSQMVVAYWLIGREIVEEEQQGEERAEYGKRLIEELSKNLTERYDKGFSVSSLWSFRQFYQAYEDRHPEILYPMGRELERRRTLHPTGGESSSAGKGHPMSDELQDPKSYPTGDESPQGFLSELT